MTRRAQSSAEVAQPRFKAKVTSRTSKRGRGQPQMERDPLPVPRRPLLGEKPLDQLLAMLHPRACR